MRICRVVGSVVSSKRVDRLTGSTYLLVQPATTDGSSTGEPLIAVDAVQAGYGDLVVVSQGSSCRQITAPDSPDTVEKAVDALVVGVIDLIDENGEATYRAASADAIPEVRR